MFNHYRFVNSTAIRFVAYDRNSATLRIIFQSNTGYDYSNVPPHVYQELAYAPSVGSYFGSNIRRNRLYRSTRLSDYQVAKFSLDLVQQMQGCFATLPGCSR